MLLNEGDGDDGDEGDTVLFICKNTQATSTVLPCIIYSFLLLSFFSSCISVIFMSCSFKVPIVDCSRRSLDCVTAKMEKKNTTTPVLSHTFIHFLPYLYPFVSL